MGSNHEKSWGQKSCDTLPLIQNVSKKIEPQKQPIYLPGIFCSVLLRTCDHWALTVHGLLVLGGSGVSKT